jgi:hypothetical protein
MGFALPMMKMEKLMLAHQDKRKSAPISPGTKTPLKNLPGE